MKIIFLIWVTCILLPGSLSAAESLPKPDETLPAKAEGGIIRVLLIGGGSSHDFERFFHQADSATLQAAGKITTAYTSDLEAALALMPNADVIVLSTNHAQFGTPKFQKALNAFADAGHGVVILHAAVWYNWENVPEFNRRFVGGGATSHGRGEFSVINRQPAHSVMQDMAADFKITDELYRVILSPGAPVEDLAETDVDPQTKHAYPSVWVVKDPKTKIIAIALGHADEAHGNPAYQKLLVNAVRWVAGQGPKPERVPAVSPPSVMETDADGWITFFNGMDLTGWDGLDGYWSVVDGAIQCQETKPTSKQSDLILVASKDNPEKFANFEMHYSWKMVSDDGNSGVQIRSVIDRPAMKHVGGYQADIDAKHSYTGIIYCEGEVAGGRGIMSNRGEKTLWDENNQRSSTQLAKSSDEIKKAIKPQGEWNDCVIIADGNRIIYKINGEVTTDMTDNSPKARKDGVIALQMHGGFDMAIQFKGFKIKMLPATK